MFQHIFGRARSSSAVEKWWHCVQGDVALFTFDINERTRRQQLDFSARRLAIADQ